MNNSAGMVAGLSQASDLVEKGKNAIGAKRVNNKKYAVSVSRCVCVPTEINNLEE